MKWVYCTINTKVREMYDVGLCNVYRIFLSFLINCPEILPFFVECECIQCAVCRMECITMFDFLEHYDADSRLLNVYFYFVWMSAFP